MLRRKLLARLGLPVAGFILGAVVAIVLLQGALREQEKIRGESIASVDRVQRLTDAMIAIEAALVSTEEPADRRLAIIEVASAQASEAFEGLDAAEALGGAQSKDLLAGIARHLPGALPDPATLRGTLPTAWNYPDPEAAAALSAELAQLREITRNAFTQRELALSRRLRGLIMGLSVGALVMVNVTVVILLWTGLTIIRPVEKLVQGSRELAKERFDHRVEVDANDEFGELARAYNRLAEQLQTNEERKTETLKQLGVTLNHELNNTISVIEMQLAIVDRRAGGDQALADHLRTIRTNLRRIASTVASLKDVRRIVVTDYTPGTPMVDLIRSTAETDPSDEPHTTPPRAAPGPASHGAPEPAPARDPTTTDLDRVQQEKLVVIGQLAAGVAHEISNPLASMDGLLQLMERYPDSPRPEAAGLLREQIRRISETVQQLRTLSHPDLGDPEPTDINELIRATLAILSYDHRLRGVEVVRELDESLEPVTVAPRAIQQALINLVINALDAMEHSEQPRLVLRTRRDGPSVLIEIEDNGQGIEHADRERVMRPFITTKPAGRGTGLGLPISKGLIEDQGGRLSFESEPRRGSAFRIQLPSPAPDATPSRAPRSGDPALADREFSENRRQTPPRPGSAPNNAREFR